MRNKVITRIFMVAALTGCLISAAIAQDPQPEKNLEEARNRLEKMNKQRRSTERAVRQETQALRRVGAGYAAEAERELRVAVNRVRGDRLYDESVARSEYVLASGLQSGSRFAVSGSRVQSEDAKAYAAAQVLLADEKWEEARQAFQNFIQMGIDGG